MREGFRDAWEMLTNALPLILVVGGGVVLVTVVIGVIYSAISSAIGGPSEYTRQGSVITHYMEDGVRCYKTISNGELSCIQVR